MIKLRVPKKYILRTYDLKGSEYDREVLVKANSENYAGLILKDLDFLKIEKQLNISEEDTKCNDGVIQGRSSGIVDLR
jgi:hypothetical protein